MAWTVSPDIAFPAMYDAQTRQIYSAIYTLARHRQPQITNWLKRNAFWTDRTGNARAGLATDVIAELTRITLLLTIGRHPNGGTLSYGSILELGHGGRYAIIAPAIDHWAPILLEDIRRLLR